MLIHKVHSQDLRSPFIFSLTSTPVYPAHIAFVLLNDDVVDGASLGSVSRAQTPLFASVIQKAGGDPVSIL